MDCLASWKGVIYFMSMIFFVAWLVKSSIPKRFFFRKVFQSDGSTWKLVPVHENKPRGLAPKFFQETVLKSTGFNVVIMVLVLANAITAAALHFNHHSARENGADGHLSQLDGFYYAEVLRTVRLIKASPMLEDFCFKAFMSMFQILTQKGWVAVMHDTMDVVHNQGVITGVAIYFVFYHLVVTLIVLSLFVAVILDNLELDEDIKKLKQLKLREMSAETQQKLPMRLRVFERFPNRPQMFQLTRLVSDFLMPRIRDSFMRQFAAVSALEEVEDETIEEMLANIARPSTKALSSQTVVGRKMSHRGVASRIKGFFEPAGNSAQLETIRAIKRKVHGLHGQEKVKAIIYLLNESNKTRMLSTEQTPTTGTRSLLSTQHQIRLDRRSVRQRTGNSVGAGTKPYRANGELRANQVRSAPQETETRATSGDNSSRVDIKLLQQKAQMAEIKRTQQEVELRENHPFFDRPLFALGRENRFRRFCLLLVEARHKSADPLDANDNESSFHKLLGHVTYLDWVAILITVLSCASMSVETPHHRLMNSPKVQVYCLLLICEYIFFVTMTIEMALKIFANGLLFTPNALLKDFGGFLDFFNYIISLIFVSYMMRAETIGPESGEHILMVLRCLRPLRIFCLVPQMRRVVYELVRGFREILMVSVLLVVFMFIFAVYGVHLFGGRLSICNDRTITVKEQCVGRFRRELAATKLKSVKGEGPKLLVPRVWANPRNFNFDNIGNAMLALFEVLSLEGWVEIRDVIKERIGPRHVIYIHLFVFIGCLIGLTLFVGVVIANYSENKGTALLTVDQRRWLDLKGRIKLTQPLQLPPRPKLRQEPGSQDNSYTANNLEKKSVKFRCFIYDITQHVAFKRASAILVVANCGLLFFPFNEAGSERMAGVRERYLVQVSLGIIFTLFFCLECLLKIIALSFKGYWQSRRNRFDMLVALLGCTWIILHFSLARNPSCLLSPVSPLGEDWNKIMHDCMIQPPFCRMRPNFWETDCGNFRAALIYFCSFYVIITYVMLNVLVAIIMENFSLFYSNDEDAIMSYSDIRNFQLAWNVIDVNRKGVVKAYYVRFLLRLIPRERVGFDLSRKKDQQLFKEMCYEVEMLRGGRDKEVSFHDVLMVLAYRTVDITKTLQLEELIAREELEYAIEEEVARQTIAAWIERCIFRNRQKHGQLKFTMHPSADRQMSVTVDETDSLALRSSDRIAVTNTTTSKKRQAITAPIRGTSHAIRESHRATEQPLAASNERAHMINAPLLSTVGPAAPSSVGITQTKRQRKCPVESQRERLVLLEAEEEYESEDDLSMTASGRSAVPVTERKPLPPFVDTCDTDANVIADIRPRSPAKHPELMGNFIGETWSNNLTEESQTVLDRLGHHSKTSLGQRPQPLKLRRNVSGLTKVSQLPDVVEDINELGELQVVYQCSTGSNQLATLERIDLSGENLKTPLLPPVNKADRQYVLHKKGSVTEENRVDASFKRNAEEISNNMTTMTDIMSACNPNGLHTGPGRQQLIESCDDVKNWWRNQLHFSPLSAPSSSLAIAGQSNASTSSTVTGEVNPTSSVSGSSGSVFVKRKTNSTPSGGLISKRRLGAAAAILRRSQGLRASSNLIGTSIDETGDNDESFVQLTEGEPG
ncbi:sodium leak channel non-selective protein [Paragonimus westermani]|uniref:Sodium leak channel non-selective protein n=1 Tax=Paragonimus westermani TaxID=34504 RepID=A0A5J4P4J5_9TREM|nr:sodium leak channel non-selective protein [Paragonimus westermani]